jgi:hypothetical protein
MVLVVSSANKGSTSTATLVGKTTRLAYLEGE